MLFKTFSESLVKIKDLNLFGEDSHSKLSPPYRLELAKKIRAKGKDAKKAGVIALFYPNKNEITHLALILRKTYKGVHSAQVGFPGGKYEETDKDIEETAIRETEEEIGVIRSQFDIIRDMSPIYIPPSNFLVHPFIAISKATPEFIKQDDEVDAIIEVSLDDFLDDNIIISTKVPTSYNVKVEVPAFILNGYIVWGATAMMLSELKDLLNEVL